MKFLKLELIIMKLMIEYLVLNLFDARNLNFTMPQAEINVQIMKIEISKKS